MTSTFLRDEFLGTFEEVAGGTDGCGDAETALGIFGGVGVLEFLLNVLDGDQAFEGELVIDDEELFDTMLVEDLATASSSVVPTGTVMRWSLVITSEKGRS